MERCLSVLAQVTIDKRQPQWRAVSHEFKDVLTMLTYERIYAVVRQIPPGKVATYGQVAELAGLIGKPRLVGYALYRVDMEKDDVPWQRVINAKGEVSASPFRNGTDYLQRSILEDEGIEFDAKGRIDLKRYRWQPSMDVI